MSTRHAVCNCGQLHLTIEGEPSRISMCHCLECQRRTGAVISNQARFPREQVTIAGKATAWMRTAESGNALTFHFCPTCGSTVYWEGEGFPGYVAVAIGSFADPNFPAPTIGVWEESRHPWVSLVLTRRPSASRSRGEITSGGRSIIATARIPPAERRRPAGPGADQDRRGAAKRRPPPPSSAAVGARRGSRRAKYA